MAAAPPGGPPDRAFSGSRGATAGFQGMSGNQGQGQGRMGFPGAGRTGPGGSASAEDSMIVLKVDPAKLPKAEDLKALLFPATLAVATDDQSVRIVTREAFPSWVGSAGGTGASGAALAPLMAMMRGSFGINPPAATRASRGRRRRPPANPLSRERHSPQRAPRRRPTRRTRGTCHERSWRTPRRTRRTPEENPIDPPADIRGVSAARPTRSMNAITNQTNLMTHLACVSRLPCRSDVNRHGRQTP